MTFPNRGAGQCLAALALSSLMSVALPAAYSLAQDKNPAPAAAAAFTVTIPEIEAVNANLDEATLRAIFSGDVAGNAEDLAGLDAASIRIPELRVEFSGGEAPGGEMIYRDIEVTDITDGVAASAAVGSTEIASKDDGNVQLGRMSTGLFDIAGLLSFYGLVEGSAAAEPRTIYEDLSFEGGTLTSKEVECSFGPISAAEFKARPLSFSFADLIALGEKLEAEDDNPSAENLAQFAGYYVELLTAFESAPIEFSGFECAGTTDEGEAMTIALGALTIGGFGDGRYPEASLADLDITVGEDGNISLGSLLLKGFDLTGPIAALQEATGALDAAWFEANFRQLIPPFEGFAFSDLALDVPDEDNPDQRIKLAVTDFDLSLADYVNGVPSNLSTAASGVAIELPAESTDDSVKELLALGIDRLVLGYQLAAAWDAASETISLQQFSLNSENLGNFSFTGTIGNASEALFSTDTNQALMAAMGLSARDVTVQLEDAGLAAIVLEKAASEQGQEVTEFQASLATMAEGMIAVVLGGSAEAAELGKAVGAFLGGSAKSLSVAITAKDEAGIGLVEFMAAQADPTTLIDKVTIDASAQ